MVSSLLVDPSPLQFSFLLLMSSLVFAPLLRRCRNLGRPLSTMRRDAEASREVEVVEGEPEALLCQGVAFSCMKLCFFFGLK